MVKDEVKWVVLMIMILAFIVSLITGLILLLFFPTGARVGYYEFLGSGKYVFSSIHSWASIIFVILIIIHLVVNWKWFSKMLRRAFGKEF